MVVVANIGSPLVLALTAQTIATCSAYNVEPRLYTKESLLHHNNISTRSLPGQLFGRAADQVDCQQGYSACLDGTNRCCPAGSSGCCPYNQYCPWPGENCCGTTLCSVEMQCCGGIACAPLFNDCCDDGRSCDSGLYCRVWQGQYRCCPATGCDEETSSATATSASPTSGTSTGSAASDTTSLPQKDAAHSAVAIAAIAIGISGVFVILCILLFRNKLGTVLRRETPKQDPVQEIPRTSQELRNDNSDDRRDDRSAENEMRVDKAASSSWKSTLYLGSVASLMVLLFNTGFAAWAVSKHTGSDGSGVLFAGECKKARNINTAFHLVINILATLVLGASSYGMQCLSAPTRLDLDRVHQKGESLDVGILSLRNLSRIPRRKLILWGCLAASSLPLHLLYNSTIFLTTGAFEYAVISGNRTFVDLNHTALEQEQRLFESYELLPPIEDLRTQQANGELDRMDNLECINAYGVNFQSGHGTLLLVSEDIQPTSGYFEVLDTISVDMDDKSWSWMNSFNNWSESHGLDELRARSDNLTYSEYLGLGDYLEFKVDYCLAQRVPGMCHVKYNLPLLVVVIVFNIVKAGILWGITVTMDYVPLLTVGDAISEFLRRPESLTLARNPWKYDQKCQRWYKAVSKRRWASCVFLLLGSIITTVLLLYYAAHSDKNNGLSFAWALGLGAADTQYLIQGTHRPSSVAGNTMMANTPQVVYSFLYFALNGALTAMAQANEWSQYAVHRKGLRVSTAPQGSQRSTYFLSLPYRYSIPQLVFSVTLHWLISQSLFLVAVEAYTPTLARVRDHGFITCGYSPLAIVCTLAVGALMGLCLAGLACWRRFASGMPVAGSDSLAIAAACHQYPGLEGSGEPHTEMKQLQWGVVAATYEGAEHCSFSADEVEMPVHQRTYR